MEAFQLAPAFCIASMVALAVALELLQRLHDRLVRRDGTRSRPPSEHETRIDFGRRQLGR